MNLDVPASSLKLLANDVVTNDLNDEKVIYSDVLVLVPANLTTIYTQVVVNEMGNKLFCIDVIIMK